MLRCAGRRKEEAAVVFDWQVSFELVGPGRPVRIMTTSTRWDLLRPLNYD